MKVDTVIALAVASLVCIGLMALVGISSDGTPSATEGLFGALKGLADQVLGN